MHPLLLYIIIINLLTFIARGVDKRKATMNWWRISERTLLSLCLVGGIIGGRLGLTIWRHKTLKGNFLWKMVGITTVWIAGLLWYISITPQTV